jgi:hypothetical protein
VVVAAFFALRSYNYHLFSLFVSYIFVVGDVFFVFAFFVEFVFFFVFDVQGS